MIAPKAIPVADFAPVDLERFWSYVEKSDGCWLWVGQVTRGYGRFHLPMRLSGLPARAHRVSYELLVGPIPDNLTLDHLCRVRNCVNPDHLEPVTQAENARRAAEYRASLLGGACGNGHLKTPENTFVRTRGGRPYVVCRRCKDEQHRRWRSRQAA